MAMDETSLRLLEALERSLLCNILLVDVMFELLAEKEILSGTEIIERIKRLKVEASLQVPRVQ